MSLLNLFHCGGDCVAAGGVTGGSFACAAASRCASLFKVVLPRVTSRGCMLCLGRLGACGGDVGVHGGGLGIGPGRVILALTEVALGAVEGVVGALHVRGGVALRIGLVGLLHQRASLRHLLVRRRSLGGTAGQQASERYGGN